MTFVVAHRGASRRAPENTLEAFRIAVELGAGLGGVGVVDRLMLLRLSPPERVGEMFGLYGLVGKFSAVVGPIVYGVIVSTLLGSLDRAAYQVAIASLFILLLVGLAILRGVPEGDPQNDEVGADALVEGMGA